MKVNRNSWHYRLMEKVGIVNPDERTNLCSYMRGILITIFVLIWLLVAPIMVYMYYQISNVKPTTISEALYELFLGVFGILGSMMDLLIIVLTIIILFDDYIIPEIKQIFPKRDEVKKEKPPNIFMEYVKAKKQKICPMIEFVEE